MTNRFITADQAKELDRISIDRYGISGIDLMGNAGRAIADASLQVIAEIHDPRIVIICGKGNNGGDGFSAAVRLADYHLMIISLTPKNEIKGDALHYHDQCTANGLQVHYDTDPDEIGECDLIIDAILGTGCEGELSEKFRLWTQWINSNSANILSVDISSGVNGNNGMAAEDSICSNLTLALGYPKIGSIIKDGQDYAGKINNVDIGFSDCIDKLSGLQWSQFNSNEISEILSPVSTDAHKHSQGKVLLIAGSKGMTGAALLSTFGALRSGSGLTITCAPSSIEEIYEKTILEGMTHGCPDDNTGYFTTDSFEKIMEKLDWCDAVVIGPGMGRAKDTVSLLIKLLRKINKPMVIDADGLRAFHEQPELMNEISVPYIITPHEGEFCELIDKDHEGFVNEFPSIVESFMENFPGVLVLKNAPTVTFFSDLAVLNNSGNPGMATAGMGDVLAGILGTFLAQGSNIFDAAKLGVYIHGLAADQKVAEKGTRGLIASDVLNEIPIVLNEIDS